MIIINGEEISERELARQIINEMHPECERKSKMMEEEEYWDYVLEKEFINIKRVLELFESEFEIRSMCEINPCPYWIMRDVILERFP